MIHSKNFDPNFKFLIASELGAEDIKKCPARPGARSGKLTDPHNPRRIIRMACWA
jgi:hypothetical protein